MLKKTSSAIAPSSSHNEMMGTDSAENVKAEVVSNHVDQAVPAELANLPKRGVRTASHLADSPNGRAHRSETALRQVIQKFRNPLPLPPPPTSHPVLAYDRDLESFDNFRSSDEFDLPEGSNPTGWKDLHVSGSGSIASIGQITRLRPSKEHPVVVLDAREESHAIVGGYPGTWRTPNNWGNAGKSRAEALADEHQRIQALKAQETVQIFHRKDVKNEVRNPRGATLSKPPIFSEEELVRAAGAKYVRLTVTDHLSPRADDIDAFIHMEREMAPHERLHVHCGMGLGRTTIFIVMHDILRNAATLSFEDIIHRQRALNPGRSLDYNKDVSDKGRSEFRNERSEFLPLFYEYAKQNPKGQPLLWSEWLDHNA
ncbi:type III secretion system effector XopH [Xanthomonas phaseoli]|uniref:type III secretion system effector XopH n=2 Tax=Xanthomonas phaseoli TaxID=1985254 RepID=UPI00192B1341|nr:type III secretion system effector XopH [Xanthomonas phaseoli]